MGNPNFVHKQQEGFSLLEVLIAALVFSIGLLGLASLQVTGLKMSHDSLLRSIASMHANDMADRMRANYPAFALGQASPYNNPTGALVGNPGCLGESTSGSNIDIQCNPTQMAQQDFYDWAAAIKGQASTAWHPDYAASLPSGDSVVCIDSTPEDGLPPPNDPACDGLIAIPTKPIFTIKIWWQERKDQGTPNTLHRFVTSLSL